MRSFVACVCVEGPVLKDMSHYVAYERGKKKKEKFKKRRNNTTPEMDPETQFSRRQLKAGDG